MVVVAQVSVAVLDDASEADDNAAVQFVGRCSGGGDPQPYFNGTFAVDAENALQSNKCRKTFPQWHP